MQNSSVDLLNQSADQEKKALDTGMSKGTVYYIIRHVVKAKLRKKFNAHQLNMAQIQKRRARSWKLYI
ncbi:hypothetical protein DPMN_149915 [Dreissena polymorpha]|uniref:Uncharacterized protein n=1 Tax=Dreissena polymorpha TaxID=45954 RepID=A0A9D4FDL3_DREPO|nr:hypothetical protein DPMN_149915 [Dreissena polymorpha]